MSDASVGEGARARPRWRTFVRGLAFAALVGFFFSGLVVKQIAERKARYLPVWIMFSGVGINRSQVQFWTVLDDGSRHEVDPYEVLGFEVSKRSKPVFYVRGTEQAHRLGLRICRELGRGTDLRMKVRTARPTKWRIDASGKHNLCTSSPKKRNKNRKKRKKRKR